MASALPAIISGRAPIRLAGAAGSSGDGGDSWTSKQVTPAGTNGNGPTQFGLSGCTVRTDSHGVAYLFAEMFENPTLVGLPTHGFHVMWKSFDGGKSWTKMQVIRQINDPCFFVDPVYGRCVMDGFAGARTDLSAIPSVDIANGAPTGAYRGAGRPEAIYIIERLMDAAARRTGTSSCGIRTVVWPRRRSTRSSKASLSSGRAATN